MTIITPLPCSGASVRVCIEVARWSFIKRRPDGSADFLSPLPCPYNYGSVEGTRSEDGDPLDAVVLGARIRGGASVSTTVYGVVHFVDAGQADPKLICADAPLDDRQRAGVERFFRVYAGFKRALYRVRPAPAPGRTHSRGAVWDSW